MVQVMAFLRLNSSVNRYYIYQIEENKMAKAKKKEVTKEAPMVSKKQKEKLSLNKNEQHQKDIGEHGHLSLKKPHKTHDNTLHNPAVVRVLGNDPIGRQVLAEEHDRHRYFKSQHGKLENMTLQRISPEPMAGLRKTINAYVESFDKYNEDLNADTILRPDHKRARLGQFCSDIHGKLGVEITAAHTKETDAITAFDTWATGQLSVKDSSEQILAMELRQRTASMNPAEILKKCHGNPQLSKAVLNDPLTLFSPNIIGEIRESYLSSIDSEQIAKRNTANENLEYINKAMKHLDKNLSAIYQTPEMQNLIEQLASHGEVIIKTSNSGGQ